MWYKTKAGKQYAAAYRKAHRKENIEYSKKWRAEHPGYMNKYETQAHVKFNRGKFYAKKRGIPWNLTKSEFEGIIEGKSCFYCDGVLPHGSSGLDRKDNSIGYEVGNVVPCCTNCNKIKNDILSFEEMIVVSQALKKFRGQVCH